MQKTWLIDLLLLTLLTSLAFSFFLGSRPLNVPDEGRYCEIAREMLVTHDFITPHINGIKYFEKPALFYWMEAAGLKLFGLNEWGGRFFDALMGLLGVLATYFTARKLFDRKTAIYASIILATSLLYFALARVVTLDMTVSVWITLTLFSFILEYYYLVYIFAALAVLTKGLIGIIFPGSIIFLWLLFTGNWRILRNCHLISGLFIFLLITLPWHILVQLKNPEFFNYYFIVQQFNRYLTLEQHRYEPEWFYIPVTLLGLFPWTGFLYGAIKNIKLSDHKILYLVISVLFMFIFFSFSKSKLVPYILPCFPFLAILIAKYFETSPKIGYFTTGLTCIALVIAIPIYLKPDVTTHYKLAQHISYALMGILLLNALTIPFVRKFWLQVTFSVVFLFTLCAIVPYIYMGSIKPMALLIKHENPTVITYDYYYQDLPFYLNKTVTIANWSGELEFGNQYNHKPNLMIKDDEAWKLWNSDQIIYMITPVDIYKSLLKNFPEKHFYFVAEEKNDILISNHEVKHDAD